MSEKLNPKRMVVWPDGTTATLGEVWNGEFNHMSDDFEILPEDFAEWLRHPSGGAMKEIRLFPDAGIYTGTHRLLFHWTLVLGEIDDRDGYLDRWCYATEVLARTALQAWDPTTGGEPEGWHRHPNSGRRRENGNPERESRDD